MRFFSSIAAILISGLCWYFANDLSGNYGYLLWVAPIPVLIVSFQSSPKKAFLISFIAYLLGRLSWLPYLLTVLPAPLAIFFTVFLPLVFALIILPARKIVLKYRSAWSALAMPVFWSMFEFLLLKFSPDGTAGSIAYSQSNFLPVIQMASVTGILGISFLVTLFPSVIAVWIFYRDKKIITSLCILFSLIFISLLFGIIRINTKRSTQNEITAGLVVIDEKFHSETNNPDDKKELGIANLYADEIAKLAQQDAQVAVLPEKIVNVTPASIETIQTIFLNTALTNHIAVVAGYTQFTSDDGKQNKAWVISPDGKLLADYQKVNLFEGEAKNGFVSGNEIAVFNLNQVGSGVAICKDMDYPNFIRKYDENSPQILYVPAWDFIKDGWLHSRMAVLRGIENGFAVIRTARQGQLTISDYRGKILYEARSTNNKKALLTGKFPLYLTHTIYGRFGDWFGYLNLIFAVYFVLMLIRDKKNGSIHSL